MEDQNLDINSFPVNSWVSIKLSGRSYMGRAFRNERAHLVATVDDMGRSVTFSWPFICANASEVRVVDIKEKTQEA